MIQLDRSPRSLRGIPVQGTAAVRDALDSGPLAAPAGPVLDAAQQAVVRHDGGPLLVLAGPGTGKTTTIAEAVVRRIGSGAADTANASDVLVLTFGRAAAAELRQRISLRCAGSAPPLISTFHSFCYAIVNEFADPEALTAAPRLLSGPEQEARVRELLTHAIKEGRVSWPAELDPAVGTRGLAAEVRKLIARAQSLQLDSAELGAAGQAGGVAAWTSVSEFLGEYLDVLDAEGVLDYSELISRAILLAESPAVGPVLRARYKAIYVDEYQDTDPAQVRLLQAMITPVTTLVAVGDPDQAIYAFRGAQVGGILRFRDDFPGMLGEPAPIQVLTAARRFGPEIREAAASIIRRVPLGNLPAEVQRAHRSPQCLGEAGGLVEVITFDSDAAQASAIADTVRRARLHGEVAAWSDIAVLVRSASALGSLQQALISANVPVRMAAADVPLRNSPGIAPLLDGLRVAAELEPLTADIAHRLLLSPLGRMEPASMRRLGRALREASRANGVAAIGSADLIRDALVTPSLLLDLPDSLTAPVERLASLLASARKAIRDGQSVSAVLWLLWSSSPWPKRLQRTALSSGPGARAAERDLDAAMALFSLAEQTDVAFDGKRGAASFLTELESQMISSSVDRDSDTSGRDAVCLMTAHRSKGLEWPMVIVAGVQEGTWPDLRVRGSLLHEDRLSRDGLAPRATVADALDEERRLMFVACTRARRRLVVTAVASGSDGGEQPSRFLDALAEARHVSRRHEGGFRTAPLSSAALVAELRSTAADESVSGALRNAAARRLAALAADGVAAADPANWQGIRDWTANDVPVRAADLPVSMSGSSWTRIDSCSLNWFLEHEVKGQSARGPATAFGSVIHALADAVARGELPADQQVLAERAGEIWAGLGYEASWQSQAELSEATAALMRFANWHSSRPQRELVSSEAAFSIEFEVPGDRVALRGSADRVERDSDGALHIVDLKTERKAKSAKDVAGHQQLSLYQVAAAEGAFSDGEAADVAGAELVQLRVPAGSAEFPKVQAQEAIDPSEVKASLAAAVQVIRSEGFEPSPEDARCRNCAFARVCPARAEGKEVI